MFAVIYMYMYAVMNKILGTSRSENIVLFLSLHTYDGSIFFIWLSVSIENRINFHKKYKCHLEEHSFSSVFIR